MTQRDHILQELNELGSNLASLSTSTLYRVPDQYFDRLAEEILMRIKALEAENPIGELEILSPLLSGIPRVNTYQVSPGYFEGLHQNIMDLISDDAEQNPEEELEEISPFLGGLKKQMPYAVPANYFDDLKVKDAGSTQQPSKIVSIGSRRWLRYAAAAVITTFIAVGALLFLNREKVSIESPEWVEKSIKKVSTDELDKFIEFTEDETQVLASNAPSNEVKELAGNISDEEMQDFLMDIQAAESNSDDDELLLN